MLHRLSASIHDSDEPDFYANWCLLYQDFVQPPFEIAIVGNEFEEKRKEMMRPYLPNALFLGGRNEGTLELLKDKLQNGQTLIYVCTNKVCKLPVSQPAQAMKLVE